MSWKESLQQASLDGVDFQCRSASDSIERALALYEYPHRDGAEIEDLGQKAGTYSITAVLWGDQYEATLADLRKVLDRRNATDSEYEYGVLIHPIYGALRIAVQRYNVRHTEDRPDYCEIDITFIERSTPASFFAEPTARQKAEATAAKVVAAQDASTAAVVKKTPSLASRLRSLRAKLDAVDKLNAQTAAIRAQVNEVIVAGLDVLTYPSSWASDTRAIFNAIAAAPRAAASRIQGSLAGFAMIRSALWPETRSSGALAAPVLPAAAAPGTAVVDRTDVTAAQALQALGADLVLRERALALADAAGELLGLEADVATLTPADIASMASQTRQALQEAIDSARATLTPEDAYAVIESLRDVAQAVLTTAEAVILARPPLVTWGAPSAGNLLLIAHWRYGDASRADELARLNPGIARRVFVQQGETITGFAR